jgi:DNA-binding GntR family transcriptional regulator
MDAIAAIESLDSAAARERMRAHLQDLFSYLAVVYRRTGNLNEVSTSPLFHQ